MISTRSSDGIRKSVVQVIGTTGVGKSQLGIELSKVLNGEVINSDSMQVYRGLDIITNKHPLDKRHGIEHHLLGFLDHRDEYRITNYEKEATAIIDNLHKNDILPVVVGGTAYYATALVFRDMLPELGTSEVSSEQTEVPLADRRLQKSTQELYADLQRIDPIMATRWHPNDHRKIQRSLEIYYASGRRQSEIYSEQRERGRLGPEHVKYRTLFLWLWSDQAILDARLDARIDGMIESGLFDEIRAMHNLEAENSTEPDFTRGIFQAIGYKEFQAYLRTGTESDKASGAAAMKAATRRYARRQIKWIRNKLLLQCREAGDDVQIVLLDATNLEQWQTNVYEQGLAAVQAFLKGGLLDASSYCEDKSQHALLKPKVEKEFSANPAAWERHTCTFCPAFSTNSREGWTEHLNSSGHKSKVNRAQKKRQFEQWKAAQLSIDMEQQKSSSSSASSESTVSRGSTTVSRGQS